MVKEENVQLVLVKTIKGKLALLSSRMNVAIKLILG
jgi:hypothetical protein